MPINYLSEGSVSHDRLCAMVEILGKIVANAPRSIGMAQLEEETGRAAKDLAKLCASLVRSELVVRDPCAGNRWALACEPSTVTLEDVFRCMASEQQERAKPASGLRNSSRACRDVDLLVTLAMLAVNQSLFKILRQFPLDRLKVCGTGMVSSANISPASVILIRTASSSSSV